jgi:hypothetical protein
LDQRVGKKKRIKNTYNQLFTITKPLIIYF